MNKVIIGIVSGITGMIAATYIHSYTIAAEDVVGRSDHIKKMTSIGYQMRKLFIK